MLSSPELLYFVEHGQDEVPDHPGSHALSAYELASRLSYHFWQTLPDDALWQAAQDGSLLEPTVLAREVERLIADPRTRATMADWFSDWLELDNLPALDAHAHGFDRARKVRSLAYCAAEVEAAAERWRRALAIGGEPGMDAAAALKGFAHDLRRARDLGPRSRQLALVLAGELEQRAQVGSLDQVTAWLAEREARLVEAIAADAGAERAEALDAEIDAGLERWRTRMPARVVETLRRESRARRLLDNGQRQAAAEVLKELLERHPEAHGCRRLIAMTLAHEPGFRPEVEGHFLKALEALPKDSELRHRLATYYRRAGMSARAILQLRLVLSADPSHAAAWRDLGELEAGEGRRGGR